MAPTPLRPPGNTLRMRNTFCFIVACTLLLSTFCAAAHAQQDLNVATDKGPNPWTSLNLNNDPKNFQFAIVTDRTGGHRAGVFEDAITKLNLLQPEFVMSVGDLIEGYSHDEKQVSEMWDEFQSFVAKLKMPFFYVPGNHDLSNEMQQRKWAERFGRKYYHFVYRDVLFLCLNSEDPVRHMGSEQIEYVRKALAENKNVRWTLVFLHQPLWMFEDRAETTAKEEKPTGWDDVEKLLSADGRKYTVFAGHLHNYIKSVRNDRRYIVLASTGGGSKLRGIPFGEFDHVAWVTMTDEGPVLANLMLSGIWDEDVTTAASRQRVSKLVDAGRVVAPPLPATSDTLAAAVTTQVKLINDADVPLTVAGRFRNSDQLRPDPYLIEAIVPPNSVKLVDVKLEPRSPAINVVELTPVQLDVTMSYDLPRGGKLEYQKLLSVGIDRPLPLVKLARPITIDGKMDDWQALPIPCTRPARVGGDAAAWKGPTDASYHFGVANDAENLYVGVDAIDDRVIPQSGRNPFTHDGIEVRLDARPAAKRAGGGEDNKDYAHIVVCPLRRGDDAAAAAAGPYIHEPKLLPPGTRIAAALTDKGYAVEIAVPLAYVKQMAGSEDWRDVRINLLQNDRDDSGATAVQLWWRPHWPGDESYLGSGTFERQ